MQHIVNIAFDFDDEKVKSNIEKTIEKQVVAERIIRAIFLEHKDEIIEKAAYILADSFKRTKAWKEAAEKEIKL